MGARGVRGRPAKALIERLPVKDAALAHPCRGQQRPHDFPGQLRRHGLAQDTFGFRAPNELIEGQAEGELDQAVIQKRHAGFHRMGHTHGVAVMQQMRQPVEGVIAPELLVQRAWQIRRRSFWSQIA